MIEAFVLLLFCTAIAAIYVKISEPAVMLSNSGARWRDLHIAAKLLFVLLLFILSFFSGLRSRMNDTATYLGTFTNGIPSSLRGIAEVDWSIGHNPLFRIYQILIRTFITKSGHGFLFVTAIWVVSSNLIFLRRYSTQFGFSLFLYIAFCVFAFSMGAMKQTIAMAIGIWTVPCILKKQRIRAALLILVAMMIHPYVIVYFAGFFLHKAIWDRRTVLLLSLTIIGVLLYGTLISRVISLTASFGDAYDIETFTSGNGINIFRLAFYFVVPVLSFIYRKQLRETDSQFVYMSVNYCVLAACFMVFARIGDANMFGRMANYLDLFQCLALCGIVFKMMDNRRVAAVTKIVLVAVFLYYYYTYYNKYVTGWGLSWNDCIYNHISIVELISGW